MRVRKIKKTVRMLGRFLFTLILKALTEESTSIKKQIANIPILSKVSFFITQKFKLKGI